MDVFDMLDAGEWWSMLAQDGAAPLPGDIPATAVPVGGVPGGGPLGGGGAPAAKPGPFGSQFVFIMLGMVVLMIIVSTLGPRRERKKREAMISAVKKHDRVQTVGGVIGAIVELKPDYVVLKVDESANTRITFARSAIQQVLSSSETASAPIEEEK
jgi:preprotein translocase subunit YajC